MSSITMKPGLTGGHVDLHIPLDRPEVVQALAVFMSSLAGLPTVTPFNPLTDRYGAPPGGVILTPAPAPATVKETETVEVEQAPVPQAQPGVEPSPPSGGNRRRRGAAAVQTATGQPVAPTAVDTMAATATDALASLGITPPAAAVAAAETAAAAAVVASVPAQDTAALAVALGAAPPPAEAPTPAAAALPDPSSMTFAQDFVDAEAAKRAEADARAAAEAAEAARKEEEARKASMGHPERLSEAASLVRTAQGAANFDINTLVASAREIMGCERFADCPPDKSQALLDMLRKNVEQLVKQGRLVLPTASA